jgi:hypothetical protein
MAFTRKIISVTFALGSKQFTGTNSNTVTMSGLRVSAAINQVTGPGMIVAHVKIFGLPLSQMNQLSTLGLPPDVYSQNTMTLKAGDDTGQLTTVFQGVVQFGDVDLDGAPDSCFSITSYSGLDVAALVIPPTSAPGSVDAATLIQGLASKAGRGFENNGVSVQLSNPYYHGSARDQIMSCAKAGNFNWYDDGFTISIWPQRGSRKGTPILVSAQTGMVGYPKFSQGGVIVRTEYNPNLVFGRQIKVQSVLTPACGVWAINGVDLALETETPGGAWFQTITAYNTNLVGA